jgi:hypothetical protein
MQKKSLCIGNDIFHVKADLNVRIFTIPIQNNLYLYRLFKILYKMTTRGLS